MDNQITTVEIKTFDDRELSKVFNHLCVHVIRRKRHLVKKHSLKLKRGQDITWDHVFKLLNRYGIEAKMEFSYDSSNKIEWKTNSELNSLKLKRGVRKMAPMPFVETGVMDP